MFSKLQYTKSGCKSSNEHEGVSNLCNLIQPVKASLAWELRKNDALLMMTHKTSSLNLTEACWETPILVHDREGDRNDNI